MNLKFKTKNLRLVRLLRIDKIIKNQIILEWIDAILFALIVVGIFRTWGYAPYKVPTGSMLQTIQRGDFLFANMHSYGFIIPFTDKKIFKSAVKRQDIVIFPYPQDPSVNFIKRVIGLPGDQISIRNEIVFINGRQLDEPYKFLDTGFFAGRELEITVPQGKYFMMGDNRRNFSRQSFLGVCRCRKDSRTGKNCFLVAQPRKKSFQRL